MAVAVLGALACGGETRTDVCATCGDEHYCRFVDGECGRDNPTSTCAGSEGLSIDSKECGCDGHMYASTRAAYANGADTYANPSDPYAACGYDSANPTDLVLAHGDMYLQPVQLDTRDAYSRWRRHRAAIPTIEKPLADYDAQSKQLLLFAHTKYLERSYGLLVEIRPLILQRLTATAVVPVPLSFRDRLDQLLTEVAAELEPQAAAFLGEVARMLHDDAVMQELGFGWVR